MQHFKILETDGERPDILIYRDRGENGIESVNILAIGVIDSQENMFACEKIIFETHESAINFIKDFSQSSA